MHRSPWISHACPAARRGAFRRVPSCLALLLCFAGIAWSKAPARSGSPAKASSAARPTAAAPRVDSARVKRLYLDGEFDAAIAILEDNLKETRAYNHGDSVFILKHLGVMYAAQYDTREKGKYFMHRLLEVEPSAKIMDMYASDMIYMIFKNIQEEYEQTRMALGTERGDAARKSGPAPAQEAATSANRPASSSARTDSRPEPAARPSGNGRKWLWAGVAAATVATGVGAYVVMNEKSPSVKESRF